MWIEKYKSSNIKLKGIARVVELPEIAMMRARRSMAGGQ